MKYKVSKKTMKEAYGNRIIEVGYCQLQHLLSQQSANAYSTRAEGWACDWYEFPGFVICTGYAPIGKRLFSYEETEFWDKAAEKIIHEAPWDEREKRINNLLADFVGEVESRLERRARR